MPKMISVDTNLLSRNQSSHDRQSVRVVTGTVSVTYSKFQLVTVNTVVVDTMTTDVLDSGHDETVRVVLVVDSSTAVSKLVMVER